MCCLSARELYAWPISSQAVGLELLAAAAVIHVVLVVCFEGSGISCSVFPVFFFERTRPAASMRPPRLLSLSDCYILVVSRPFLPIGNGESCTCPISTNNRNSTEANEPGITRVACFVARCLELVAVLP